MPRGLIDRGVHPVVQRRHVRRFAGDVLVVGRPHHGLPVAEEIERGAHARREVLPARHVRDGVVVTRGHERDRGEVLHRHFRVVVVEAKTEIQRQPAHGPPILCVHAQRRFQVLGVDQRPRVLRDRRRDAAQERPRLGLIRVVLVVPRAPHVLHTELERVAAGHVVRREPHVVLMVRGRGEDVPGAIRDAEPRLGLRDDGVGSETVDVVRFRPEDPRLVVERESTLEQQLVGLGPRPARLEEILRAVREVHAGFRRGRRAALVAVHEPLIEVAEERDLVLGRRLPREVERLAARPRVAADRLIVQIL